MQDTNKIEHNSQNSPPLLGFDCKTVQEGSKLAKSCRRSITDFQSSLKLFCSTPLGKETYQKVMEISFSQNFEDFEKGTKVLAHLTLDGDSGYVSHFQESNSGSCIGESSECSSVTKMVENNIYISEDALLERPEVHSTNSNQAENEQDNLEEYSHLFYLNDSVVGSSGGGSERTCLSGLENDSDISSVIYPIDNIVLVENDCKVSTNISELFQSTNEVVDNSSVNKSNLTSPIIKKFKKPCSSPLKKTSSPLKTKQINSDENKENDINCLNISKPFNKDKEHINAIEKSIVVVKKPLFGIENCKSSISKITDDSDSADLNTSANTSHTKSFDSSCLSPELFSDDETAHDKVQNFKEVEKKISEEVCVNKDDEILLKRTRDALKGVLPPPSVTIIQISTDEILNKIYKNSELFFSKTEIENIQVNADNKRNKNEIQRKSLLFTSDFKSVDSVKWPEIAKCKFHGLLYNRAKFSEEFEHLCQKYGERFVGVETQSTCTVFSNEISSPSKRKLLRARKVGKSPGKRLSHLARRRITFSKDSLHSISNSFTGARSRQILIDARKQAVLSKSPQKTPRKSPRKTPKKSPRKRRTPSSSTKKKRLSELFSRTNSEASTSYCSPSKRLPIKSPCDLFNANSESSSVLSTDSSSSTSKRRTPRRALFTSPKKLSPQKGLSSLYSKKKLTPKRALFMSPEKDNNCDKKRKRSENDSDESELLIKTKLPRSLSFPAQGSSSSGTENPRILSKFKSSGSLSSSSIQSHSQDLTEHRKKKLLWAVSEALRSQNVSMVHPQFKVFATVLARVTRRLLPNLNTSGTRSEGSTSELMLRIARQHVFAVTRGKTVDEILLDVEKNKAKQSKPGGSECPSGNNKENRPKPSTSGVLTQQNNQLRKSFRDEKVERIRRAINFGECVNDVENKNSNI